MNLIFELILKIFLDLNISKLGLKLINEPIVKISIDLESGLRRVRIRPSIFKLINFISRGFASMKCNKT